MRFIGFEREDETIQFAKDVLLLDKPTGFCRAVGAEGSDGSIVFAIVMCNFTSRNVDMHIAAVPGAQWATPASIIEMFNFVHKYVFDHLGAARVTGLVRNKNKVARRFIERHLGYEAEGLMRKAFNDDDLRIYGFLKEDFEKHPWYRS